jgi:hypothetical protein
MEEVLMVRVEVPAELHGNTDAMHDFLERHYLRSEHFELAIVKNDLPSIEFIFDRLVQKHGILKSQFTYRFLDE